MKEGDSSGKIHPERLKNFVRHVCVVAKKHKNREDARAGLEKQIASLKKFSSKKKDMDEELEELDSKISQVLEKEKELLGTKQAESAFSAELMRGVRENRDDIKRIEQSLNELRSKFEVYLDIKTERERNIKELEKRIRAETEKKKDISSLKGKLKDLEGLYRRLKSKGADVSKVESRINTLNLRLNR